MMVCCYWCILILIIIPTIRCCSLPGLLCGWSAVVLSSHFVSTISHEQIQEIEVMVFFDVESLFTNVPNEGAMKAALCKRENDPGLADRTNLTLTQIADLLNFVLRSMYFQYNGSIYEQKDGAAMKSPFSVVNC